MNAPTTAPTTAPVSAGPQFGPAVVKVGGSCVDELPAAWWDDLAGHVLEHGVVLVHGWSKPLRGFRPEYGQPSAFLRDRFGNQSRWTTPQVVEDIVAISDIVCAEIARRLAARGATTRRVIGSDGLLTAGPGERLWWRDKQLVEIENLVGPIVGVDVEALAAGGEAGPGVCVLVTPLARNLAGRVVNTDADRAAAAIAGPAGASTLVLVTDVSNLYVEGEPVGRISVADVKEFRDKGAKGGMRKKLRAAGEASDRGIDRVVLGSESVSELLAERSGTVITPS